MQNLYSGGALIPFLPAGVQNSGSGKPNRHVQGREGEQGDLGGREVEAAFLGDIRHGRPSTAKWIQWSFYRIGPRVLPGVQPGRIIQWATK